MSELIVYLSSQRAGRLIRKPNGNLQFRYDPDYTGPAISQALPIQKAAHPHATCHAVFGGLLLEGDARAALAHAKNFSLLYDTGEPMLAPLYDLVSTTIYPALTRRLAMNIDGARQIDEVRMGAWTTLGKELEFTSRFAPRTTNAMVDRVVEEANRLAVYPEHDNDIVKAIIKGIHTRARVISRR